MDRLVNRGGLAFPDLERLAMAELAAGIRAADELDGVSRPLLVFGDHGFRVAPDGHGFIHGGGSTLERLVPLVELTTEPG